MVEISLAFAISVFIAGVLMFLAPCTLPLVPAYLAFIGGATPDDLAGPSSNTAARRRVVRSGIMFVIGFSVVFIAFGTLAGLFGGYVTASQTLLTRVGGVFIILFGLMMLGVIRVGFLEREHTFSAPQFLKPGEPTSALIIGATFAIGWTPCVGPVLASVLLLASTQATALSGAVMLTVFSLGLAIPFLLTAVLYARASRAIENISTISRAISYIGGAFLILIGVLLLTDNFGLTIEYGYKLFDFLNYDALLDYL